MKEYVARYEETTKEMENCNVDSDSELEKSIEAANQKFGVTGEAKEGDWAPDSDYFDEENAPIIKH